MRRVAVVGTTGSGKTTFARALAARLGVPHVELDALHWGPNWTARADFRERVAAATAADGWVTDGNYAPARDIVLSRADTVVWLDLPLGVIFPRLIRRTVSRLVGREALFNGNREPILGLFDPEGPVIWALRTHGRRRREYEALFATPEMLHLDVHRIRSESEANAWLRAVGPPGSGATQIGSRSRARE